MDTNTDDLVEIIQNESNTGGETSTRTKWGINGYSWC